jgi:hypothetical protein
VTGRQRSHLLSLVQNYGALIGWGDSDSALEAIQTYTAAIVARDAGRSK